MNAGGGILRNRTRGAGRSPIVIETADDVRQEK